MPVRRQFSKGRHYRLTLDALNRVESWDVDEYEALRTPLLAMYRPFSLELLDPFWRHEPGIPTDLRTLPPAAGSDWPDTTARDAIRSARRAWLADHPQVTEGS